MSETSCGKQDTWQNTQRRNDFFISDLNSKNGTLLNDRILEPEQEYLLHNGDKISIAGTELQYLNFQNKRA